MHLKAQVQDFQFRKSLQAIGTNALYSTKLSSIAEYLQLGQCAAHDGSQRDYITGM